MHLKNNYGGWMRSILIIFLLLSTYAFSAKVIEQRWQKGETFSEYLADKGIPQSILEKVDEGDAQFFNEIHAGQKFYELVDEQGNILQTLIAINSEMQIQLYRDPKSKEFEFDIIPIEFDTKEYFGQVQLTSILYNDIVEQLGHKMLAARVSYALKKAFNARYFKVGDEVAFYYSQDTRMGMFYGAPHIKSIMIKNRGKEKFISIDEETGRGYDGIHMLEPYTVTSKQKVHYTIGGGKFALPLKYIRITSPFSLRRWHPVLKRYRPHHGVDFGAKRGTPIMAIGDGRVIYAGWMRGYGNVVKIDHGAGVVSLYAHQSKIKTKKGAFVKSGEVIGYVGNTGVSSGPHLHLGIYKNRKPVNPMNMISRDSKGKSVLKSIVKYEDVEEVFYKKVPIPNAKENKAKLLEMLKSKERPYVWKDMQEPPKKEDAGNS